METIAVLGAGGMMGLPIARNLARADFPVRAWNRSLEKAQPLAHEGAEICESPAEAAGGADVIISMLADADVVLDSVGDALDDGSPDGLVWVQMSTIGENGTERCIELARDRDVDFVDAPVLGTIQPAVEGKLVVLASGPHELQDRLTSVFDAIGQRTMWVGEAGAGTRLKVATNTWVLAIVEAAAETLALAEGLDLDPRLVLDAVRDGPLDLPYLQMKAKAIIERDFEPSFKLALAAKDASLIEESAQRHGLDLPLPRLIRERMGEGAREHPDYDMSATYLVSAP